MKNYKKICNLIALTTVMLITACSEDKVEYTPGEPAPANCMNVYFPVSASDPSLIEIDPADKSFVVPISRPADKSKEAANVPLVVSSGKDYIDVPETIAFKAGQTDTTFTVKISEKAPIGKQIAVKIAVEDKNYANPYGEGVNVYGIIFSIVKWNNIGEGQFYDAFALYSVKKITIEQRDDQPNTYRISYPYTEAMLHDAEWDGCYPGAKQENIIFYTEKNGDVTNVTWDDFWYTNLLHEGAPGADIKAYLTSSLDPSLADGDANNVVKYAEDGESILYFSLFPYYYIDGMGGYGTYNVLIAFPGFDLAAALELPVLE